MSNNNFSRAMLHMVIALSMVALAIQARWAATFVACLVAAVMNIAAAVVQFRRD